MKDDAFRPESIRAARDESAPSEVRPADKQAAGERPGDVIARYKLLEQIGEGGMGTIWMAEQREPVKRRVALKIIKLGMDTRQVIARFEAERQALALMDHPHIAKVLDAGSTETGRPYFVMEYIRGIPILEYCDQEKLDTQARLELFISVCHAIQHAHQKGIIHRDIKPSNVLVTMHDGVPVPKVIDFGIAKATNAELTTKTLFTEHRQMVGTPAYMSPEQAEMSGLDIDTRSDVYSLGVLLYELLTGTTPFDTQELLAQGYAEMMRTIREVEPHKPSTRISTLGDTGTRTAHQRRVDVKKLGLLLRGDLDWIVMKCLEKDRTRRYETANGLAADIKRHLHDEPVTAGAPSASYTLRKFVKRNRAQVLACGIVSAALVLGLAGASAGLWKALREKRHADAAAAKAMLAAESETQARVEAQANAEHAIEQAHRAEAWAASEAKIRARAESITNFVLAALGSGDAFNSGGSQNKTILAAMGDAVRDIDAGRFADNADVEGALRSIIAVILRNNGRLVEAEQQIARALELCERLHSGDHIDVSNCLANLALVRSDLGRSVEAEALCRRALEMSERLRAPDSVDVAITMNTLAMILGTQERVAEAEELAVRALEIQRRASPGDSESLANVLGMLATLRLRLGRLADAETICRESLEMLQRLHGGDHPDVAKGLNNLAAIQQALGCHERTEELMRASLEMYERLFQGDHPDTARALNGLGLALFASRRFAEAESLQSRALEMRRRLYRGDHEDIVHSLQSLAGTRDQLGRSAECEELCREWLEMARRLYPGDHLEIVSALGGLAGVQQAIGRLEEAERLFGQALEMAERVQPAATQEVLRCKGLLATALWHAGKLEQSIPMFESLVSAQEKLLGLEHYDTLLNVANLGINYKDAGRLEEAVPLLERAQSGLKASESWVGESLLDAYTKLAMLGRPDAREKAVALIQEDLAAVRTSETEAGPQLAASLAVAGKALLDLQASAEAEAMLRECLAIRERTQPGEWTTFNAKSLLGGALLDQGKPAEAEPLLLDGYRGMKTREASIPPGGATRIPEAIARLVQLYEATGNATEASAWRGKLEESKRTQ